VLQEPFLYSKTVGENLRIAARDAAEDEMYHATRVAAVDEDIRRFANGYDTLVGERGVTLSGGQKQRIAIARTLMMHCPIMIFDDSMSAVDMETDAAIRRALREDTENATVLLISHRINTLMQADKILVLENGTVTEEGTHAQLIERPGAYQRVYRMQSDAGLAEGGEA
jgi:ATP-binding cassette subfamily B protein